MPAYLLYVDDLPIDRAASVEEAKAKALTFIASGLPVKIESLLAPASNPRWEYDYRVSQWVEQR
jgi:hypothetical protein